MARRRVDTKFVIILSSVLTLAAGGMAVAYVYYKWRNNDPNYLLQRAQQAEVSGKWGDALTFYARSANRATDLAMKTRNWDKYGDIAMQHADGDEGNLYYKQAINGWYLSLRSDFTQSPSGDKLLTELFSIVRTMQDWAGSPFDGTLCLHPDAPAALVDEYMPAVMLRTVSTDLAAAHPENAKARACRTWSLMYRLLSNTTWGNPKPEELKMMRDDVKFAMEKAPDDPTGFIVGFLFEKGRADLMPVEKWAERTEAYKQALAILEGYNKRHPEDMDVLVDWIWARQRMGITPAEMPKVIADAKVAYEKQKNDPVNPRVNPRMAAFLSDQARHDKNVAAAEGYLADAVKFNPGNGVALWRLAKFQELINKWDDEIKLLDTMIKPTENGKGVYAFYDEELKRTGMQELPRIQLLIAAREAPRGVMTEKGKQMIDAAKVSIDRLSDKNPQDVWVEILTGRMEFLQGAIPQAYEKLKDANERLGTSSRPRESRQLWSRNFRAAKLYLADVLAKRQDMTAAIDKYQELLQHLADAGEQDDYAARMMMANLLMESKKYPEAEKEYEKVISEVGNDPVVMIRYADALNHNGKTQMAHDILEKMGQGDMADLVRGSTAFAAGDLPTALARADKVLAEKPKQTEALYLKARILRAMNKNDEALKIIDDLCRDFPDRQDLLALQLVMKNPNDNEEQIQTKLVEAIQDPLQKQLAIAGRFWMAQKPTEALAAITEAEKINADKGGRDSAQVVEMKFRCLLALKRYDEARTYANRAAVDNIDLAGGKVFEGQLEMAMAKTEADRDAALTVLKDAASLAKDSHSAHMVLADAYRSAGRNDDALKEYRETIRLKSDSVREIRIVIQLLMNQRSENATNEARSYLALGLLASPNDKILRAYEDQISVNPAEVVKRREEQFRRFPDDVDNTQRLAMLYMRDSGVNQDAAAKARDLKRAAELADNAVARLPDNLPVAHWAAGIYRDLGMQDKALELYQPFLASPTPITRDAAKLAKARMYRTMQMPNEASIMLNELVNTPAAATKPANAPEGFVLPTQQAARELADMLFDMEQMAGAEAVYRHIEQTEGKSSKVTLRLCEALLNQRKFDEADKRLAELLAAEPDNLEAMSLSGFSLILQKKLAEAGAKFAAVLDKDPDNLNALHYRAFAEFSQQGNLQQAIDDLLHVKTILAKHGLTGLNGKIESRVLLARVYRLLRRFQEASREYSDVSAIGADTSGGPLPAAITAVRAEYTEYLGELATLARNLPEKTGTIRWMDDLKIFNPAEKLETILTTLMASTPKLPIWVQRYANLMIAENRGTEALPVVRKAAGEWKDSPEVIGSLLLLLVRTKQWDEAITVANTMVANPKWNKVGELYALRAAANYGKNPKSPLVAADIEQAADLTVDFISMFSRYRQLGADTDPKLVTSILEARLQKNPTSVPARMALAVAYLDFERTDDVVPTLEPALKEPMIDKPDNKGAKILVIRTLGDACFSGKKYAEALKYYNQILAIDPDDLEALNNTAYILADELKKPAEGLPRAKHAVEVLQGRPAMQVYFSHGNVMDSYGWVLLLNAEKETDPAKAAEMVKESVKALKRASDVDMLPLTMYHLARAYDKNGDIEEAKRAIKQGVDLARGKQDPSLEMMLKFADDLGKRK